MTAGVNNGSERTETRNSEGRPRALWVRSMTAVGLVAVVTVAVLAFRDEIAAYATLGYPAIFVICAVLNCGVFGLSPSGLVAVEMSFVFDPVAVALVAGCGAGIGELVSYFVGRESTGLVPSRHLARLEKLPAFGAFAVSFVGSFVSGNASDAIGVCCGRARRHLAPYFAGALAAKVCKMLLLVMVAHGAASELLS